MLFLSPVVYADRIITLSHPIRVCFFISSGVRNSFKHPMGAFLFFVENPESVSVTENLYKEDKTYDKTLIRNKI